MKAKSLIHTQLITDVKALKFSNNNTCFTDVQRIYATLPTTSPFAQVLSTGNNEEVEGMDYDSRVYNFSVLVYDLLQESLTQSELDLRIDRMSNIEDVLLDYLAKIPNNMTGKISGINCWKVDIGTGDVQYAEATSGIQMILKLDFRIYTLFDVKS